MVFSTPPALAPMAGNILASLTAAGIIERTGAGRQTLRITPRFLAHAERHAGATPHGAIQAALASWNGHLLPEAAQVIATLMAEHDQFGALRPVFPPCVAA